MTSQLVWSQSESRVKVETSDWTFQWSRKHLKLWKQTICLTRMTSECLERRQWCSVIQTKMLNIYKMSVFVYSSDLCLTPSPCSTCCCTSYTRPLEGDRGQSLLQDCAECFCRNIICWVQVSYEVNETLSWWWNMILSPHRWCLSKLILFKLQKSRKKIVKTCKNLSFSQVNLKIYEKVFHNFICFICVCLSFGFN